MSGDRATAARRGPALAGTACVALLALWAAPARADCADADSAPSPQNVPRLVAATLCLLDEQRAQRSLPALRPQVELTQAAQSYAADMVAWRFFDHVTPAGRTLLDRVQATGYLRPAGIWALGENLAWGSGLDGTPRQVVAAWMASAPHRANLLEPAFRDVGIGVAVGVPVRPGSDGATYTTDFGARTLHRRAAHQRARTRFRWAGFGR